MTALGDARKAVQRAAAEDFVALDRQGVPVRAVLEEALGSPARRQRWGAAFALARLGVATSAVVETLVDALADPDGDLRWAAAGLLRGLLPPEAFVTQLCVAADTGSPTVRKMVLYALRDGSLWDARCEALAHAGLGAADSGVRLAAMAALARRAVDRAAARTAIERLHDDPHHGVRRAAAATLARL